MSFNFTCSHCKATLEAEDDWAGRETVCPVCQEKVMILRDPLSDDILPLRQRPPRDAASEATSKAPSAGMDNGRKKASPAGGSRNVSRFHWLGGGRKYFWGRLFIFLTWVQAGIVWLVGIGLVILIIILFNSWKEDQYKSLREKIPGLQESQKKFAKDLMDTIDLLAAKKNLSGGTNGEITGFQLPQSIRQTEIAFNEDLETVADVDESLKTLDDCINNIIPQLQEAIKEELYNQLVGLEFLAGESGHSRGPAHLNLSREQPEVNLVVSSGEKVNFYEKEGSVKNAIEKIRSNVKMISGSYQDNMKIKNDLNTLLRFLDFIQNNLLSSEVSIEMELQQRNFSSTPDSQTQEREEVPDEPGELEYQNIINQLKTIYLADQWKIWSNATTLRDKLDGYKKDDLEKVEKSVKTSFYECLGACVAIILFCIVWSFFLLVIADVLRAHFDSAEFMLQKQGE